MENRALRIKGIAPIWKTAKRSAKPLPVTSVAETECQHDTPSSSHQPAVDRDHRARHIVGQISREEFDHLGAILDAAEPPQGHQLGPIPIALAAAGDDRRHDPPGGDHAGGDAVHRDRSR